MLARAASTPPDRLALALARKLKNLECHFRFGRAIALGDAGLTGQARHAKLLHDVRFGGLGETAANRDRLASHPAGGRGGQEHCDRRDVVRLPQPSQCGARYHLFFEIAADDAHAVRALGLDPTRIDRVNPDLLWPQLFRQHAVIVSTAPLVAE